MASHTLPINFLSITNDDATGNTVYVYSTTACKRHASFYIYAPEKNGNTNFLIFNCNQHIKVYLIQSYL